MRVLAAMIMLAGCAVDPPALTAHHPASPAAETGRLVGAPATLRPGVATYADVPALRDSHPGTAPVQHHHHGS